MQKLIKKEKLDLVNNLDINLGNTPEKILNNLDKGNIPSTKLFKTKRKASSLDYKR